MSPTGQDLNVDGHSSDRGSQTAVDCEQDIFEYSVKDPYTNASKKTPMISRLRRVVVWSLKIWKQKS